MQHAPWRSPRHIRVPPRKKWFHDEIFPGKIFRGSGTAPGATRFSMRMIPEHRSSSISKRRESWFESVFYSFPDLHRSRTPRAICLGESRVQMQDEAEGQSQPDAGTLLYDLDLTNAHLHSLDEVSLPNTLQVGGAVGFSLWPCSLTHASSSASSPARTPTPYRPWM